MADSTLLITRGGVSDIGAEEIGAMNNLAGSAPLGSPVSNGYMCAGGKSWADNLAFDTYNLHLDVLAPLTYRGSDALGPYGTNPNDLADYSPSEMVSMSDSCLSIVHISKFGGTRLNTVSMYGYWANSVFRGSPMSRPASIGQVSKPAEY